MTPLMMVDEDSATACRISARLLDGGAAVEIDLDGTPRRFHACWLRDNAQDDATRSAGNGQRLITLLDYPGNTRIGGVEVTEQGITLRFEPEGKSVTFGSHWLRAHAYDHAHERAPGWTDDTIEPWDATFASHLPIADYQSVVDHPGIRLEWLRAIARYGAVRLTGGTPEQIAALFGFVRETNYGRVFDVKVAAEPGNLADTYLGLQAHTDNPYRDPVPGLQILCCLRNSVAGGETLLVDGFDVARRLQAELPDGFALLASYNARFEYAGTTGVRLRAKKPIIELGVDGELIGVRFNNRSAAPFVDVPPDRMIDYYRAYRRLAELIEDPASAVRFALAPGDAFVVDNHRVLHGRTKISGFGARHLQGCYVDKDGLLSTIAAIEQQGRAS